MCSVHLFMTTSSMVDVIDFFFFINSQPFDFRLY